MKSTEKIQRTTPPYPPSFIDRLLRFIEKLPIPYWATYLLLFIVQSLINHVLIWVDGGAPFPTFHRISLIFPLWLWIPLAIVTFLNKTSETTLDNFRPLLTMDDDTFNELKYKFTTNPRQGVVISSAIWLIVIITIHFSSRDLYARLGYGSPVLNLVSLLEGVLSYSIGSVLYYQSLRQLWLVNRTLKTVKRFNLFNLNPVYAFSRLTAWTGISWVFMAVCTLLLFPLEFAPELLLGFVIIQFGLAFAAFVLPLRFVNSSLVLEKLRLLTEHQQRVESTLARLHQQIDQNELSEMEPLNYAVAALNAERDILEKIPTLPWRTETLKGFLSATVLPIILLIIQMIIQKWLGG
mgnify:CR=1 FL=1